MHRWRDMPWPRSIWIRPNAWSLHSTRRASHHLVSSCLTTSSCLSKESDLQLGDDYLQHALTPFQLKRSAYPMLLELVTSRSWYSWKHKTVNRSCSQGLVCTLLSCSSRSRRPSAFFLFCFVPVEPFILFSAIHQISKRFACYELRRSVFSFLMVIHSKISMHAVSVLLSLRCILMSEPCPSSTCIATTLLPFIFSTDFFSRMLGLEVVFRLAGAAKALLCIRANIVFKAWAAAAAGLCIIRRAIVAPASIMINYNTSVVRHYN